MIKALFKSMSKWGSKTSYAITDQALFSGTNFIANIMMARWLVPYEYGGFVIIFSIFLLMAGIHNSLILQPLSIFAPRLLNDELKEYFGFIFQLHIVVIICIMVTSILLAFVMCEKSVGNGIWALPISAPLILQIWFVRRLHYAKMNPNFASVISLGYFILVIFGILFFKTFINLSIFTTFIILGISSLMVSFPTLFKVVKEGIFLLNDKKNRFRQELIKHWKYGKWILGEWLSFTFSIGIFPIFIGYFGGIQQAGEFRAIQNFVLPLIQAMASINLLILPWASKRHKTAGDQRFSDTIFFLFKIFSSCSILYFIVLIPMAPSLVRILYDNSEYVNSIWILNYLSAEAIINAFGNAFALGLRAAVRPNFVFLSRFLSASITICLGIVLGTKYSLHGLLIALISGSFIRVGVLGLYSWKIFKIKKANKISQNLEI